MWITKEFKTKEAMQKFIDKNENRIQWVEIFINNSYGIEYRKLRFVY
jgi:glutaredoxin 2